MTADDLIERLRERDAVWQKQCDGWVENWKAIGGMDADEVACLRRTVYAEAADALASKDKALEEMRQEAAAQFKRDGDKLTEADRRAEALMAELERCHARLEIDHYYVMVGDEEKLERREVPWAGRADGVDGIDARDATIALQDDRIKELETQAASWRRVSERLLTEKLAAESELELVKPRFKQGDRVSAMMHQGPIADGLLCRVETNYGQHDDEAYHVYSVLFDGHSRQQHLGDRQIISIAARAQAEGETP